MPRRVLVSVGSVVTGLAVLVGVLLFAPPSGSGAGSETCAVVAADVPGAAASGLPVRPLCALPAEAARVWAQIRAGGPFRSDRDGITFGNREGLLPPHPRGFYREYTVPTPGEDDRGARRLVTGGEPGPRQELYYTGDHYASFVVVDPTGGP